MVHRDMMAEDVKREEIEGTVGKWESGKEGRPHDRMTPTRSKTHQVCIWRDLSCLSIYFNGNLWPILTHLSAGFQDSPFAPSLSLSRLREK